MRNSTAIGSGGLYSLTCDACWTGFNTLAATDWSEVESQAAGWKRVSGRDYCPKCGWVYGAQE